MTVKFITKGQGEIAPYTGNYISKETLNVKAFAEAVGGGNNKRTTTRCW